MIKKILLVFVILIIISLTGCINITKQAPDSEAVQPIQERVISERIIEPEEPSINEDEYMQVFEIEAINYRYVWNDMGTPEIKVKLGDVVKFIVTNEEGFHDLVLDAFNVNTGKIYLGKSVEVVFTADRKGSFDFYCSVGDHRAKGMVGTLIVE